MARKRYICARHNESTPSAVVYGDHYFCFGCGAKGDVSELGLEKGESIEPEYVEDLQASLDYIRSLPLKSIRGFSLHANDRGYFLVWPEGNYYKFRAYHCDNPGGKYRGPSGHKKPEYVARTDNSGKLYLVEGEFNAMTLAILDLPGTIISPGGAGDFTSKGRLTNLARYATFNSVSLIVDSDKAGAIAAIETKAMLAARGCSSINIFLVEKDFNDIYAEKGKQELTHYTKKLGL